MNLIGFFKPGKLQVFIILLIVLGIIVLAILSLESPSGTPEQPQPSLKPSLNITGNNPKIYPNPLKVTGYTPTENTPLIPGQSPEFVFQFDSAVELKAIGVEMAINDTDGNTRKIDVTSVLDPDRRVLRVKPAEAINPSSEYKLAISYNASKIFDIKYISDRQQPQVVPSNNPQLIQFLPHETDTYILSFFPEINSYNFSFKYNANSDLNTQDQFEAAKREATEFIESNGVDPNSLVITWSYK
jgi:hypothetical protein